MKGSAKTTTYLATVMMTAGFLLIVLGWNGAAGVDYVQGQIPFLISGGLAGTGLIVGGVALTVIQEMRRSTGAVAARLERIAELLQPQAADEEQDATNLPAPRISRDDTQVIAREGALS